VNPLALKVRNLTIINTGNAGSKAIVNRLDFNLEKGEVLALVGESGCGKTKTAEAIMGLLPTSHWKVTADKIELNGTVCSASPPAVTRKYRGSEVSMIFQEPLTALDPVFSCGYQISSVYRRHLGSNRRQAHRLAITMLEQVGFADPERIFRSYPHQLSGGMRQRVMIAMAMSCRPAVLIADEPTTALDVTTQAQVLEQMIQLGREYNTAILLITHDLGVVAQYADRVMVMLNGEIVESADVADLFERPQHACTHELLSFAARMGD